MRILSAVDLAAHNSFGVKAKATKMIEVSGERDFLELNHHIGEAENYLVLSGGSNILFVGDFDGTIIKVINSSVSYSDLSEKSVSVKVSAGYSWNKLVEQSINKSLGGLENLSLIPGSVGAAPIQNIGAYGVEVKDRIASVEAVDLNTNSIVNFDVGACQFGYRDSLFKRRTNQFLIKSVTFNLDKHYAPVLTYGPLKKAFEGVDESKISPKDVAEVVIKTRKSKLPDPKKLGNAGSFFKNPIVGASQFASLKEEYNNIVGFELDDGRVKIAAGWLIDHLGLKGFRKGDAGVHENQALVLVNYGNATGRDIYELSKLVQSKVKSAYEIELEPEVRIIGRL